MPPNVRAYLLFDADLFGELLADLSDAGWMHRRAGLLPRKQPVRGLPPAPIGAQLNQQFGRQHDLPGPLTFSFSHQNQHPLAVDVSDLELKHFGATQPSRVKGCQQCTMLQIRRGMEQRRHLFAAQHRREFSPDFGSGNLLDEPVLFQRFGVEELERGDPYL